VTAPAEAWSAAAAPALVEADWSPGKRI